MGWRACREFRGLHTRFEPGFKAITGASVWECPTGGLCDVQATLQARIDRYPLVA